MVAALRREDIQFAGNEFGDTFKFAVSLKTASTERPTTASPEIRLRNALKSGDMQTVSDILRENFYVDGNGNKVSKFDINWVDEESGYGFLHIAAESNNGERAFQDLIDAGIDIRITAENGKTAYQLYSDRYAKQLQDGGYRIADIEYGTTMGKLFIDKATEEIAKIAEGDRITSDDFADINRWVATGGSLIPLMPKASLFDVMHLRAEDQLKFVKDILGGDSRVQDMIDKGEVDPDALMDEELQGLKPYEFFKSMADNEGIAEEDRTRYGAIAEVLKDKNAPGSEEREPEPEPEPAKPIVGPLGPDTQIPESDKRTAEQIAADSKVYSQLHEKDRKDLLDFIGKDVTDERHKVYLAVAVLNHIEHFNEAGEVIPVSGEGRIDGWTRSNRYDRKSEAQPWTEAGRFQDLLRDGWGHLKGDSLPDGMPPRFDDPPENLQPSSTEEKEAQEIVKSSQLLSSLSQNDKDALKSRLGDFDTDPRAARIAIEVLNHIERYDDNGKPIEGGSTIGNGRIDGWTRSNRNDPKSHAENGTEAGRFQNFIKHGWSSLKTETDAGEIADIEALEKQADGVGDNYSKFEDFMNQLKESAYYGIISEAGLPSDKRDFIENPDKYSTEERAAAVLELMIMRERIGDGIENYSEYGVVHGTNQYGRGEIQLHSDPKKVLEQLDQSIQKLMNDDVATFISDRESEELQEITGKSSKLREFMEDKAEAMRDDAWGFDEVVGKTEGLKDKIDRFRDLSKKLEGAGSDEGTRKELEAELSKLLQEMGDPLLGAMGAYFAQATTTNIAAGTDGNVFDDKLHIDLVDNKNFDVVTAAYDELLANPAALNNLIKGGMKPEEAIAQMNSRAATFASFGSDPRQLSEHMNANIQNYYLENTKADELVGVILKEDGSFDEEKLNAIIDKIKEEDSESPLINGDNGEDLSNAQIIAAVRSLWDTARGVGKLDFSLSKFWANRRPLNADNPLHKTFAAGGMHLVSGLLASGAMIAKAAGDGLSEADIVGAVGSGLQTIGLSGEAWSWQMRDNTPKNEALRDRWNNARSSWRDWRGQAKLDPNSWVEGDRPYTTQQVERKVTNFKHFMRFAGATGGGMILGASIAMGLEEMKKGNEAGAAVLFTSGAANAATLLPSYIQSIVPMFTNAQGGLGKWDKVKLDRFIGRVGIIGGALGTVANAAAFLAVLGYTLYAGIKEDMKTEAYFKSFTPTLAEYNIDGDGENDPWWNEDHDSSVGS